jgi:pyrimidine-specific ribonucleoside hydrolase
MKKLTILFLLIFLPISINAHPWKPNHYVIIDTDGGIDDLRAIIMMLASPDVRVLGITVSPGALTSEQAYVKVKSLLKSFYHEGIPVGINKVCSFKSPEYPAAKNFRWGPETGIDAGKAQDFITTILQIFNYEKTKVTFVCLGGLSTANLAYLKIPEFKTQVKRIVWSCNGLNDKKGFNFNTDRESASAIIKREIPLQAVLGMDDEIFDPSFLVKVAEINTPYAGKVNEFSASEIAQNHIFSKLANDELIPVFIHNPEIFINTANGKDSENKPSDPSKTKELILKILKGETVPKNQVIKAMPPDPSFYFDDIQSSVKEITEKYGEDEWISGVIANELHRHLGVFAIIGVKMGIRAREYFATGVDEFRITSFAGSIPPLSCMNDGIQVSTGATPGHGLLTVISDTITSPSCLFSYMNYRIRITLKPEIAKKISGELKEINFIYGLDSNIYWELVRKNSIKYWKELDRHEIFEIEVVN